MERPGEIFDGSGQISLTGVGADGTPAVHGRAEWAVASFEPGDAPQVDRHVLVDVMYWNTRPDAVTGTISLSVHAYAVSPVPEPASFPLAAVGASLLLVHRGRRARTPPWRPLSPTGIRHPG